MSLTSLAIVAIQTAAGQAPVGLTTAEWTCWRGPGRSNISEESAWSSTGADEPLWRGSIGAGYSTPIVGGGRVYAVGYYASAEDSDSGRDEVVCLDALTGEKRWTVSYASIAFANEHRGGVIGTPTLHGGVLYVASRQGELRALRAQGGKLLWTVNLAQRHGLDPDRYGFASSPYIDGDRLVVCMGSAVALDLQTGETQWISEPLDACFSTVAALGLPSAGRDGAFRATYAAFGGNGLFALDAATGETLRCFEFRKTPRNVEGATPVVLGTDVFVSSGYDQGGALVDMAADPPVERWRSRRMRTKMAGTTYFAGHFFGHDESMLACLDREGNLMWRERGLGHGALSIAGDRMLITTSEGELVVAAAVPDEYRELSRRKVVEDGVFWATPVLVGGLIYVRGSFGDLVCLDHREAGSRVADAGTTTDAVTADVRGEYPTANALEARYLESTGIAKVCASGLSMRGTLHVVALGLEESAASWEIDGGGRWHCSFDPPPGMKGAMHEMYDGEKGWTVDPHRGDKWLEDGRVAEMRATRGFSTMLDPIPDGVEARVASRESFRGVRCYRVDLSADGKMLRSVFFAVDGGRYAGRTSADESTVVLADWRQVEGGMLPFKRTTFDPETGLENRWAFDEAALESPDAATFEIPESLR